QGWLGISSRCHDAQGRPRSKRGSIWRSCRIKNDECYQRDRALFAYFVGEPLALASPDRSLRLTIRPRLGALRRRQRPKKLLIQPRSSRDLVQRRTFDPAIAVKKKPEAPMLCKPAPHSAGSSSRPFPIDRSRCASIRAPWPPLERTGRAAGAKRGMKRGSFRDQFGDAAILEGNCGFEIIGGNDRKGGF